MNKYKINIIQIVLVMLVCLVTVGMYINFRFTKSMAITKWFELAINQRETSENTTRSGRECYTDFALNSTRLDMLEDVTTSTVQPSSHGLSIFFHVSSCLNGSIYFTSRQACAIESTALANPQTTIFVLFASPVGFDRDQPLSDILAALSVYENVMFRNVNLWRYTVGTPVEEWMQKPDLFKSNFLLEHMADLLRLLTLYKFGGTHIDLDFIVLHSFSGNRTNFAANETYGQLANGLLNLDRHGIGHVIADECLKEFVCTFNGSKWGENGPLLIGRVLERLSRTTPLVQQRPIFTALAPHTFYAIHYTQWKLFFDRTRTKDVLEAVNHSMAVHFWNKLSADHPVRLGEGTAYDVLAMRFCPRVYKATADGVF